MKRLALLLGLTLVPAAQAGSYFPPPPDTHPVWSPDTSTIAYYRFGRPDEAGVRVVLPDGTGDRRLAGVPQTPFFAFSPDWRLLAAVVYQGTINTADLEVQRPEQGEARVIATDAWPSNYPAFSPDGSRIAYTTVDAVWTIGADGSAPRRIAPGPGRNLAWSPDGEEIAFDTVADSPRIVVAHADGSGAATIDVPRSTGPAWSPDGRTLAWFSFAATGAARVWIRNGDRLTSYPIRPRAGGPLLWSPGGSLFYTASDLYRLDLVSGRSLRVGPGGSDPALSPDGSRYAYAARGICGDRVAIYVRSVAATAPPARRLTNDCHVYGTNGPDRLVSSNQLYEIVDGLGGNDTLIARGAAYVGDALEGGPGDDVLRGGFWPERLDGGPGSDVVYGGPNYDTITGGPGRDRLYGQGGRDTIYARDGEADVIDCGSNTGKTNTSPERDTAYVDRRDVVRNCERLFRSR